MDSKLYREMVRRLERTPGHTDVPPDQVGTATLRGDLMRMLHAAIGMCTEVGELQDAIKKHLIYDRPLDRVNVVEELGDVLWYLVLAADACGVSLEDVMRVNAAKLARRYGDKFTTTAAVVRDLDAERAELEAGVR